MAAQHKRKGATAKRVAQMSTHERLHRAFQLAAQINADYPQDIGAECIDCGKPNVYGGSDGRCTQCRMIWDS